MVVRVKWFYHPEETNPGKKLNEGKVGWSPLPRALLLSFCFQTHICFFSSSWAQRWDQKSGRSLSTALQASNQRKDFMEVGELGGGLGCWGLRKKWCWGNAPQLLWLLLESAAPRTLMGVSGRVGVAAGCWEEQRAGSRTHLCICIREVRVTNSWPPCSALSSWSLEPSHQWELSEGEGSGLVCGTDCVQAAPGPVQIPSVPPLGCTGDEWGVLEPWPAIMDVFPAY